MYTSVVRWRTVGEPWGYLQSTMYCVVHYIQAMTYVRTTCTYTCTGVLTLLPLYRWMHEVRVDNPNFTFGVSTRGYGWSVRRWQLWPVLRLP